MSRLSLDVLSVLRIVGTLGMKKCVVSQAVGIGGGFALDCAISYWEFIMKTWFISMCLLALSACQMGNTSANNAISTVPQNSSLDTSSYRLSDFQALAWGKQENGQLLLQIQTQPVPATWPIGVNYQLKDNILYVSVLRCLAKFPCPVDKKFQVFNEADWPKQKILFQPKPGTMIQQAVLPPMKVDQVVMLMMGNEMISPVALMPEVHD